MELILVNAQTHDVEDIGWVKRSLLQTFAIELEPTILPLKSLLFDVALKIQIVEERQAEFVERRWLRKGKNL